MANPVTFNVYLGAIKANSASAFFPSFPAPGTTISLQAGPLPMILSMTVINATAVDAPELVRRRVPL